MEENMFYKNLQSHNIVRECETEERKKGTRGCKLLVL